MALSPLFRFLLVLFCFSINANANATASRSSTTTILVGAGMSGIMAAKTLSENGMKDFVILEATNRIGGRMHKESIAGYTVEKGANWVEGVGGPKINPIWTLAKKYQLGSFYSDWSNLSYNIYSQEEGILSQSVVARPYKLATLSADFSSNFSILLHKSGGEDISILASQRTFGHYNRNPVSFNDTGRPGFPVAESPNTKLQMFQHALGDAIDFFFYDFEIAEPPKVTSLKNVEPNPTFEEFGEDEYFIADSRGFEHIVHGIAEEFLHSSNGSITDPRLKLNKVVREIEYTDKGVKVSTEDASIYTAKNVIVSVSVGVLQTKLIDFKPDLPLWKLMAIYKWDMVIYCKIFMKFPSKFWPTGPGTEFFIYVHEKRGYYNFWQHLENEYPGGNLLMVTVTDDEARRIEQQNDHETKAEIMVVLKKMFGNGIPEMEALLIPKWGQDRFYKGTYSNWPIGVSTHDFANLKAPIGPVYFTGEHTSQKYNGYVHGAYFAGVATANEVLECVNRGHCSAKSHGQNGHCNTDIQREMEIARQAWMGKVQVLEDALSQKCKP